MRVHCTNCGRDGHAKWQCTRPTKSTATGKDRLTRVGSQETGRPGSRPGLVEARLPQHATGKPQAGTQALPVDTNNPSSRKGSGVESLRMPTEGRKGRDSTSGGARAKLRDPSAVLTQTAAQPPVGTNSRHTNLKPNPEWYNGIDALPGHEPPPKASLPWPRGGSKFDKVAYMAKYMARYRAEVKSGKRTPKPRA